MLSILAAAIVVAAPGTTHWKFETSARPHVRVSNINGPIQISSGSGNVVTVEAEVDGDRDEAAKWTVDVHGTRDEVTVRVCCGRCDHHDWDDCDDNDDEDGSVRLTLHVPNGSDVDARGVSSAIRIEGVTGHQQIHLVDGSVESRGSRSEIEIQVVSGEVTLVPAALGRTRIQSVSGNVDIRLPPHPDAKISFTTLSGALNGGGEMMGNSHVEFGSGRIPIEIHTVSGSVRAEPRG